jgi:hypothetical protein
MKQRLAQEEHRLREEAKQHRQKEHRTGRRKA